MATGSRKMDVDYIHVYMRPAMLDQIKSLTTEISDNLSVVTAYMKLPPGNHFRRIVPTEKYIFGKVRV